LLGAGRLAQPTRGEISILGRDSARRPAVILGYEWLIRRCCYDEMSGIENLRYFARGFMAIASVDEGDAKR